jgi:RNA polymerase sigma-70 factor (ECF subfamily)
MDEKTFILAAQKGDVSAFNQLVRAYQALVYRTALRVLGESAAAEDATQDAFISAFKHLRDYRGGSFKAWLLRIVTNACYDQLRAKQRRPTASLDALLIDPDEPAPGIDRAAPESPQEFAERRELGSVIQRGLATLPPDQRITLVLTDIEGFSYDQVAAATGTNLGTVKSRLSRARAALRDFLIAQEELLPVRYRLNSGSIADGVSFRAKREIS